MVNPLSFLRTPHSQRTLYLIAICVIIIDQLSKFFLKNVSFATTNTGVAFGLLPGGRYAFILIAGIVIGIILTSLKKYPYLELSFILGGTAGNLIDRIFLGHVIDFIDVGFWPVFNFADTFATIGVAMFIIRQWKK